MPSELLNGSFTGFVVTDKSVMLKDGKWQWEPYDKGPANRPEIMLLAGTYLAVVVIKDGKLQNIATKMRCW